MSGVVVLVSYRSFPEHRDTTKREIGELIARVQAIEPDCAGITMLQDAGAFLAGPPDISFWHPAGGA